MFFSLPNHRENHSRNEINKKQPPIIDNNEMLMQQTNCISTFFTQLSARNDFCRKQLKVATNIFTKKIHSDHMLHFP